MSTTKTKWAPRLLVQWHPMSGAISTTCTKRLPGTFDTQREAMEVAEKAARRHPEAIGYSAKRVEVLA